MSNRCQPTLTKLSHTLIQSLRIRLNTVPKNPRAHIEYLDQQNENLPIQRTPHLEITGHCGEEMISNGTDL